MAACLGILSAGAKSPAFIPPKYLCNNLEASRHPRGPMLRDGAILNTSEPSVFHLQTFGHDCCLMARHYHCRASQKGKSNTLFPGHGDAFRDVLRECSVPECRRGLVLPPGALTETYMPISIQRVCLCGREYHSSSRASCLRQTKHLRQESSGGAKQ